MRRLIILGTFALMSLTGLPSGAAAQDDSFNADTVSATWCRGDRHEGGPCWRGWFSEATYPDGYVSDIYYTYEGDGRCPRFLKPGGFWVEYTQENGAVVGPTTGQRAKVRACSAHFARIYNHHQTHP
jgi:hypothetical protein